MLKFGYESDVISSNSQIMSGDLSTPVASNETPGFLRTLFPDSSGAKDHSDLTLEGEERSSHALAEL